MSVDPTGLELARKMAENIDLLGHWVASVVFDRGLFNALQSCGEGTSFEYDLLLFDRLRNYHTPELIEKVAKYRFAIGFTALVHYALYADDIIEEDEIEAAYPILRPLAYVLGSRDSDLERFRLLSRRDALPFLNAFASMEFYKNDLLTLTGSLAAATPENQIETAVTQNAIRLGRENAAILGGNFLWIVLEKGGSRFIDLFTRLLCYLFSSGMITDLDECKTMTPDRLEELARRCKQIEMLKFRRHVDILRTLQARDISLIQARKPNFIPNLGAFLRDLSPGGSSAFADECFSPDEKEPPAESPVLSSPETGDVPKEKKPRSHSSRPSSQSAAEALDEALKELKGLEGLEQVKKEVKKFVAMLNVQRERQKHGMEIPTRSLHYVFYGNPGTGKTTVARILAKIFYGFGLLKSDKLTECSRSDLVAGYVGQTAIKTKEVVESALDGVLFIDEAYMLSDGSKNDDSFGQEAIDTLLKLMEDNRDRLIVIAAGYPDLMEQFLASNPGMKSRFTRFIHFEDYSVPELCHIMVRMSEKMGITLSPAACARVSILLARLHQTKDKTFGNARLVRNIFEDALSNQAVRLDALGSIPKELLTVLEGEDIPEEMSPTGSLDPAGVRWKVVCPKCGKTAAVNAGLLGKQVQCPCGHKFICPWDDPLFSDSPKPGEAAPTNKAPALEQ